MNPPLTITEILTITMFALIISFTLGFCTGFLVFRNNQAKAGSIAESLKDKGKDLLAKLKGK